MRTWPVWQTTPQREQRLVNEHSLTPLSGFCRVSSPFRWNWRLGGRSQSCIDALGDVVLDPMRIPPFLGIDLHAVKLHGEMDMVAAGHAGHAALAHDLAASDQVALMHVEVAHVAVNGLQAIAVIEHNAVAVDAQRRSPHHAAVVGGFDTYVLGDREIVAKVHLLIDLLALVDVVAQIGEGSLGLRVRLACEGLRKQEMVGCLKRRSESVLLFALRISLLILTKRATI